MAYRFTDTDKWKDGWFIELKPKSKLMFNYLCDNCDMAGFFELSMKKMRHDLEYTDDEIREALTAIEKAYVLSRDKRILFLKNFIRHQKNTPLNHRNNSHIGIFNKLENYKMQFGHDLLKLVNRGLKIKQDIRGTQALQQGLRLGNGNIDFDIFWSLYDNKVGNKKECEKKWNSLTEKIKEQIIDILPEWKKTISATQTMPYPATFLNQERWNDEFKSVETKVKSMYPNNYDKMFEAKLSMQQCQEYWKHLRSLGYSAKKDRVGNTIDWIKTA